jgi:hypothetical protein
MGVGASAMSADWLGLVMVAGHALVRHEIQIYVLSVVLRSKIACLTPVLRGPSV